jgi:tetratricopeptide (TPR) repeat protein
MRLRLALHAGEIHHDDYGLVGTAINLAFRMLDAKPLKKALAESTGVLGVIASQWFFDEVIRHDPTNHPGEYHRIRVIAKETETDAWIRLPCEPDESRNIVVSHSPRAQVPRQLPGKVAGFVGRADELEALTSLLDVIPARNTVVISAIHGTAGIGKTALAVHWAHEVTQRFPDGQLYVNLRGFDPLGSPVTPAEAVRGFLEALEVPPKRIPASLDAQAALYRSLLAGRRVLVLLDNARDAEQVRPLIPGSPGCVAVVTSRHRLTSLVAGEGALPITLDLLTTTESRQLLTQRIGVDRVTAETQAVERIIESCARLPLALAIVAARAATHPTFPLAALADELRGSLGRLGALDGGDTSTNARVAFSWSYQQLTTEAARLFRLLSLHSGPDITVSAAASLAGLTQISVQPTLRELARAHLITERTPGRYAFHDLLRAYAGEQARAFDTEAEQRTALKRMLDHYLHTAHEAALLLYPRWEPITPNPQEDNVTVEEFEDYAAASAWYQAEHHVVMGLTNLAATRGFHIHAWQLSSLLMEYLDQRGEWHGLTSVQQIALSAAQRQGDRDGQAHMHHDLGRTFTWLGRFRDARENFRRALDIFTNLDDEAGQAHILTDLGWLLAQQNQFSEALTHVDQALALAHSVGNRLAKARALNHLGWYHALINQYSLALNCCREALALYRELDDPRGESHTLDNLGYTHLQAGHHQKRKRDG